MQLDSFVELSKLKKTHKEQNECNVIISCLGTGRYQSVNYRFSDNSTIESRYSACALFQWLKEKQRVDIAKFIVLGTSSSCWQEC